ncbi:LysR family transcriptional regulator [Sulfurivirga sp.]|uniref:LysR family transcriptional regulator n=1 Tax=Sulfurivirga sp. TaxID=2614236 RepID=UPI0025FF9969|nr:LysR family transcriptional regulator [Sulfurivirga sp.]
MIERFHLRILRELRRCGSLTAAAENLHVTQSAVSHAIKKLEQRLGLPLWRKEGRRLRFTPAGEYVLALAERLLPQLEHAETVLAAMREGRRGVLRIGIECYPCYGWLNGVLAGYLAAWPDVEVDVRQHFQFGGIGALFHHEIDLLVTPDPLEKKSLVFEPVFDYELVLAVSRRHRLAGVGRVTPEMLAEETLLTYPVEQARLDIFTRFLQPAGVLPRAHRTLEITDILLQLVAAGRGVTALPRWLVAQHADALELVALPLGDGLFKQIHLGYRAEDGKVDYLRGFVRQARDA